MLIDGERVHGCHPYDKILTDKVLPHSTELTELHDGQGWISQELNTDAPTGAAGRQKQAYSST